MRTILIIVSLLALAVPPLAFADGPSKFDYFYLVRQWPATFCNDHSCTHAPPRSFSFTIHGLWPQRSDGTWPEYCDPARPFSLAKVLDLLPRLYSNWPSWAGPNRGFWSHEWVRHGTCAETVVGGQHAFFAAVLGLHRSLKIEDALSKAGIGPSGSYSYSGNALHRALKDGLGTNHHIFCDPEGNLAEVWTCIGLDLKPFDCNQQGARAGAGAGGRLNATAAAAAAAAAALRGGGGGGVSNSACGMKVRIPPLDKRYERIAFESAVELWGTVAAAIALVVAALLRRSRDAPGGAAAAAAGGAGARQPLLDA